jgi:ABC-type nitrate/sulfonate/bicarbonate transport system permease component
LTSATSSSSRRGDSRLLLGAAGVGGFLGLWQLAVTTGLIDPFFVGSPASVCASARLTPSTIWRDAVVRSDAAGASGSLLVGVPVSVVLQTVAGQLDRRRLRS